MLQRFFANNSEAMLPDRVRIAIRDQQDRSEILIGWLQLSVVVVFGGLYLVSPKTFGEDIDFAPVPWALSIYLVLTVIRLVWAHQTRLPDWSLALSVVFDMMLLMVLIWSFHLQYDQPPSFYLKAPTLLYVFIFIALRALRFEARFVLLSGVVAAIGWAGMIFYVTHANPEDTMITRDYVMYMTSNSILLGAEFDKIISILTVTIIIAVALYRARSLLIRSVTEQLASRELSRFFAPEIAERIKGAERGITAGMAEARDAAILNVDMRGFTALTHTHDPEEVMQVLADYQRQMVPVIQKHGGSIDKFLGDGIMATFGAAQPSATYAADALRAIDEICEVATRWQSDGAASGRPAPPINAAAATGRILFGAVGDESRLEYTVIGDAVNLSAKLEKQNKVTGVRALADATTYDLAVRQGYRPGRAKTRLPQSLVAGVTQPVDVVVMAE